MAARGDFEQRLAIRRKLSHFKLMDLSEKAGDRPAAREHLRQFVEVWGRLEAEGRLPSPNDQRALQRRRKQLAEWED